MKVFPLPREVEVLIEVTQGQRVPGEVRSTMAPSPTPCRRMATHSMPLSSDPHSLSEAVTIGRSWRSSILSTQDCKIPNWSAVRQRSQRASKTRSWRFFGCTRAAKPGSIASASKGAPRDLSRSPSRRSPHPHLRPTNGGQRSFRGTRMNEGFAVHPAFGVIARPFGAMVPARR